ncbi:chromate transporter [Marinobacter sp. X15-166B]|uniref:chromate transporter n=1 Tax=Marinobacter sp. X15-166B TaxID=1897620 RepID=UPI00085C2CE2|nr:chromate transporter [Marinobacter sp. X15-166B]OEY66025.1 chromate transporter [Marinobacter sp. X15-166B]
MKWQEQGDLLVSFLRTGLLGFGGGPSMIPLIHDEVVKRRGWMSDDDFSDVLAIANTLPGPIATKLPGYVGYRVAGVAGCLTSVLAITIPMIAAMILLLSVFSKYRDISWIRGMAMGVVPVVLVMMAQLTYDFFKKSHSSLGWISTLLLITISAVLIYGLSIHPAFLILTLLIAAIALPGAGFGSIFRREEL